MKNIVCLLLPGALIATSAHTSFAAAGMRTNPPAPRILTIIDIKPDSILTDQEKESVSIAADRLLIHVDQARQLLRAKNIPGAREQIIKAITLAEIIKSVMPDYTVNTEVKAGGRDYKDESKIKPLQVTVLDQLDEIAVLEPVRVTKRAAQDKAALRGDVIYGASRAQLDVALALPALAEAKKALTDNKPEVADAFLSKVQTDVDFESAVFDTPLAKAQMSLLKARQAIKNHKLDQAKASLQAAADSLEQFSKTASSNLSKEANELRQEMATATNSLESNVGSVDSSISKWWQKINTWYKK